MTTEEDLPRFSFKYVPSNKQGLKKLLRDRQVISSARFSGSLNANEVLIDINSAIMSAGLTDLQAETVAWISGADLTQQETAQIMGVSQQFVAKTFDAACEKISSVYAKWNYGEIDAYYALLEEQEVV